MHHLLLVVTSFDFGSRPPKAKAAGNDLSPIVLIPNEVGFRLMTRKRLVPWMPSDEQCRR
jgi:hypothetical protein